MVSRLLVTLLLLHRVVRTASTSRCSNIHKWSSWTPCCCDESLCGSPAHQYRWRNGSSTPTPTATFTAATTTATTQTPHSLKPVSNTHPKSLSIRGGRHLLRINNSLLLRDPTRVSTSDSQRASDLLYCHSTFSVRLCTCRDDQSDHVNRNSTVVASRLSTPTSRNGKVLVSYGTSLEQALLSLGVHNYSLPTEAHVHLAAHLYNGDNGVSRGAAVSHYQQHHQRSILGDIIRSVASFFYSFGGIVPFYPQYHRIKKSRNSQGFSTTVCLILLIANILRIQFWMLKHFHVALLLQSVSMIGAQLLLLDLCITVRTGKLTLDDVTSRAKHTFLSSPMQHFWSWSEFLDYIHFLLAFSLITSTISKMFSFSSIYAEILGSASVMVEAIILIPQCIQNYERQSTEGLSYAMMVMWTFGDFLKLTYLAASEVPVQFVICAVTQCSIDIVVMLQISLYAETKNPKRVSLPRRLSMYIRSDVQKTKRRKKNSFHQLSNDGKDEESLNVTKSLLDAARDDERESPTSTRVKAR